MIHKHLETLRSKPEAIRRNIVFVSALSITAAIFLFWVYNIDHHYVKNVAKTQEPTGEKPFSLFKQGITRAIQSSKASTADLLITPKE